ncbi:MAG TPA: hypothetical protein VIA80_07615 [Hyphomonadaceae bacterium]|jgi:hypothetical protein
MRGRRLYGTLTGKPDLYAMPRLVERYLKFAGFSLCVLALGTCARLAPSDLNARRPEPRFAEPSVAAFEQAAAIAPDDPMAVLEAQMDALGANAADLQLALKVMGPLPDPGAGTVLAAWPDAAKSPGPRTTYRKVIEPASISKASAILFPNSGDTRLVVASLPGEGAHDALCVELAALAGRCRPTAPIRAYR